MGIEAVRVSAGGYLLLLAGRRGADIGGGDDASLADAGWQALECSDRGFPLGPSITY